MSCACRSVLAALAVSCTFLIYAHGQSTQRLDRIKDLMCVLLLSGMQKEDLDVKMLNKLQQHNVNIHGMNNEELLKECVAFKNVNNNITTQPPVTESEFELEKRDPKKEIEKIVTSDMNMNAEHQDSTTNNIVKKKNKNGIQYIDGQPELQSVLKFWQDIEMNKSLTESPKNAEVNQAIDKRFKTEQKNKRNVPDASNSNESDAINKLLKNFLMKQEKTKFHTSEKINKINDIYKNDYFLNTENNGNPDDSQKIKTVNKSPLKIIPPQIKELDQQLSNEKETNVKLSDKNLEIGKHRTINSNNLNDVVTALHTIQTYYPLMAKENKKERITSDILNKFLWLEKSSSTTENVQNVKIVERKIQQNMIKEIAETVKKLVLKDLQKEMSQLRPRYLATVTKATATTPDEFKTVDKQLPPNQSDQKIEQSILNKFMDLFEEIKSMNHKKVVISGEITKDDKDYVIKEQSKMPQIQSMMLPIRTNSEIEIPLNNYRVKQYPNPNSQSMFNFSPQIHKFRTNGVIEPVKKIPIKTIRPITVQTNNMEIPPLGIPVDKPENPINQNIIVTTMIPYRIGEYGAEYNRIHAPDIIAGTNEYIQKLPQKHYLKTPQEPYHPNRQNDKRLPQSNNEHSRYNANYNKFNLSQYKLADPRKDYIKNQRIPRFHEQFEKDFDTSERKEYPDRVDCCDEKYAFSRQMVECCHRKIASRQQQSLNTMKKSAPYDDTHFKNFLKSQQKVTDMLERVLASRGRIQSVETA